MNPWYAVVCKPRSEARAEFNLVNQGYQVFLPRLAAQTRRNGKWVDSLEPLFPRYLFLAITNPRQGLSEIRSTPGVSDLVRFGGLPAAVPHEIIAALSDALQDLQLPALSADDYRHMNKEDRRLLDQFAYHYTRLQDDMGARLMPSVLKVLGEDVASLSAIDRLIRLEQLGWLPSADEWLSLQQLRNQFSHDYPDSPSERFERLQAATQAARHLLTIMAQFQQKIVEI